VQIVLHSLLFLLVFFDSQARISLLGEVNRVCMVDNLRRRGAAIAGFRIELFGSRIDLCQVSTQLLIIGTFRKIGHPSPHHFNLFWIHESLSFRRMVDEAPGLLA
jgi:hypothetical protein